MMSFFVLWQRSLSHVELMIGPLEPFLRDSSSQDAVRVAPHSGSFGWLKNPKFDAFERASMVLTM